jgi:cell volume regulation protein A
MRENEALPPETAGKLAAGDMLYVLAQTADSAVLSDLLVAPATPAYLEKRQFYGDFVLNADAQVGAVAAQYDLPLPKAMAGRTLEEFFALKLHGQPVVGDRIRLGKLELVVRTVAAGRVNLVGLRIPTHLDDEP